MNRRIALRTAGVAAVVVARWPATATASCGNDDLRAFVIQLNAGEIGVAGLADKLSYRPTRLVSVRGTWVDLAADTPELATVHRWKLDAIGRTANDWLRGTTNSPALTPTSCAAPISVRRPAVACGPSAREQMSFLLSAVALSRSEQSLLKTVLSVAARDEPRGRFSNGRALLRAAYRVSEEVPLPSEIGGAAFDVLISWLAYLLDFASLFPSELCA